MSSLPTSTAAGPRVDPPWAFAAPGAWLGADAPAARGTRGPWRAYGWALTLVAACTLVDRLLFGRLDEANLIVVYLLGVMPIALRGDRGAAIAAALAAVAAFDFFFTPPYLSFAVSDTQYVFTFAVMGLVGVVISSLTARQVAIGLDHARAREEADAAARLAERESLRSALLSSVSHDLRTPLAGIIGAASSLVDGAEALPAEVRRELAQGIVDEGDRLNRLVTNLLQATRLDEGTAPLARTWLAIEDVVGPVLGRLAGVLGDRRVDVALADDLPLVFGDPALLDLVYTNLLDNAAKHTPAGTPVSIRAWSDGARLWSEVADAGPGLPAGAEERVFERYARAGRGDRSAGTGLGLSICRAAIRAHGGAISAANRPEGGAAFKFWVPVLPAPAERRPGGQED